MRRMQAKKSTRHVLTHMKIHKLSKKKKKQIKHNKIIIIVF